MKQNQFSLTIQQLERIVKEAKAEGREDIVTFALKGNRLKVTQQDWGHSKTHTVMDKPC
ncbi:hypothetical protein ACFYKX_11495 [Cytobacillus sp. FJAT-54145]|uniref:Uncharacterized protein n=1 Tax=Cytobacillus spartinae TaxID=3299023 RepID=A0ABW6KE99_9BACI